MVKLNPFAAAAIELYKDKLIEINTGEISTNLKFADHSISQKHVIRGTLINGIGDALVLECKINGVSQTILVNCWSIISILELKGNGNVNDLYIDEYKELLNKRNN